MANFLRLHRAETGTSVSIPAPFPIDRMDEPVARQLNHYVAMEYPGFELCGFWETETTERR